MIFQKELHLKSVDDSLKRLNTEYVDLPAFAPPDALMEPEEVAEAFDTLKEQGKVRAFGVSNHNPMQIELLNQAAKGAVKVNQIQFSVAHCPTIDTGLNVNMYNNESDRDGSVLEYCRLKNITVSGLVSIPVWYVRGNLHRKREISEAE